MNYFLLLVLCQTIQSRWMFNRWQITEGAKSLDFITKKRAENPRLATGIKPYEVGTLVLKDVNQGFSFALEENEWFEVDPKLGTVWLRSDVDREDVAKRFGKPEIKIRVYARDETGADVVTPSDIIITVQDINDNSPVFVEKKYYATVAENAPTGTKVIAVRATDADESNEYGDGYGDVGYFLVAPSDYFAIDRESGMITTTSQLDREDKDEFYISVIARDGGGVLNEPANDAIVEVVIKVTDVNDHKPQFVDCPDVLEFPEDAVIGSDGDTRSVRVLDKDIGNNGAVDFEIIDETGTFGIFSKPAEGSTEVNTNTYGLIFIQQKLDFESTPEYRLKVKARNLARGINGSKMESSECSVTIEVSNVDEPPVFDSALFERSVYEGSEPGTELIGGPITARDPEGDKFEFEIKNKKAPFKIDAKTGILAVAGKLDREEINEYYIDIIGTCSSNIDNRAVLQALFGR